MVSMTSGDALSLAEVHQLTDDLAASGLIWQPPLSITRAQADEIKSCWAAELAKAHAQVRIEAILDQL